jgi:hypothetical protein
MSDSPRERSRARQRAPIRLADAPLADYRPTPAPEAEPQSPPAEVARPSRGAAPGGVRRARAGARTGTPRAADPRTEPTPLAREATRSVNFHIPGSLDRALGRLKYELEAEYGVRTSKTALTAAALYALPREPLAALAWLRVYEAAVLPLDEGGDATAEGS